MYGLKYKFLSIIVIGLATAFNSHALDTSTAVFSRDVKTLQVRNPDNFMAPPVIRLGTADRLFINFDIIEEDKEYLRYRLIHCNADWQPSRLVESEYIDGFNEAEVTDYAYSSNTYVHYVNYNIEIPNADMPIIASGNYLLQVYPENDVDDILLQARFSVTENTVAVTGNVTSRTDMGFNSEYQQLSFSLTGEETARYNPYQDLVITVTQNNRPETMRVITHPMRVQGKSIIYEHNPDLVFKAGNEYRRFETVRADYPGMHTDSVRFGGTNWHAWLKPDMLRSDRDYVYDRTQHGRFKIDEYNSSDPDLGADYVTVHFTLDAPEIIDGDIYVDGDFTLHKFDDFNRLAFDRSSGLYTAQIPLKQGSYNYQYVVRPRKGGLPVASPIEGDKYETNNEYLIQVFLRQPGSRGDRLVGSALMRM